MLSIHFWGFAGRAVGDTQEQPQAGGHRSLQEELSPCLCKCCPARVGSHLHSPRGMQKMGWPLVPSVAKIRGEEKL